jgi:hypothetical protein
VFLTRDDYSAGAEAANRLAITGKPVEVRLEIPLDRIPVSWKERRVKPVLDPEGEVEREGFGTEFQVNRDLDVRNLNWTNLGSP